jgi:hypothetical protein
MRLSRRSFVKAGAVAGAAVSAPVLAAGPRLVIYDSGLARSRVFAKAQEGTRFDVSELHASRWHALRRPLPQGRIAGLTRWSDYVMARGFAEEQGRRLVSERRVWGLIAWEMA